MTGGIFICYRREDSAGFAGRIYDRLKSQFDPDRLFIDVDNIEPGVDFVDVLSERVGACDALIAVVGKKWLAYCDDAGHRRLDDPHDFVRIEIETALARNVRVIPVLVDGAAMPHVEDLPAGLAPLTRRQNVEISHARFDTDAERLVRALAFVGEKDRKRAEEQTRLEQEKSAFEGAAVSAVPVAGRQARTTEKPERDNAKAAAFAAIVEPGAAERTQESSAAGSRRRQFPVQIGVALGLVALVAGGFLLTGRLVTPSASPPVSATSPPAQPTPTQPAQSHPVAADNPSGSTPKSMADDPNVRKCDLLAASDYDSERPKGVPGVDFDKLDTDAAESVCNAAIEGWPDSPRLTYELARIFEKLKNSSQAIAMYRKAAQQNYAAAQNDFGWLYDKAIFVEQDYAQAAQWYRKAAEQGSAPGQNNLGWLYENGKGVTQDNAVAAQWYRKSADQGNATAQSNLGWLYEQGKGVNQDYAQAAQWYRKAADQGNATAQNNLGWLYQKGRGVTQDYVQAAQWYRKAAEQGNSDGQNNFGWLLDEGKGVPQDYAQAAQWYRKAADQGNASAQNNLGWLYANGKGVTQDYAEAAQWYRKAADQGNVYAQVFLAGLYENGQGVPRDLAAARTWYASAADQGNADAKQALDRLRGKNKK